MTDNATPTPEQMTELEKDFCLVGLMLRGLAYEDAETLVGLTTPCEAILSFREPMAHVMVYKAVNRYAQWVSWYGVAEARKIFLSAYGWAP